MMTATWGEKVNTTKKKHPEKHFAANYIHSQQIIDMTEYLKKEHLREVE